MSAAGPFLPGETENSAATASCIIEEDTGLGEKAGERSAVIYKEQLPY